jgi:ribosome-associated protein
LRGHPRRTPLTLEPARAPRKPAARKTAASPKAKAQAAAPAPEPDPISESIGDLENLILAKLDDDQAQDVVYIDLKGKSPMADGLVVASGRSQRHVGAMADHLLRALKDAGHGRCRVEGMPAADWVLIDAGDVIVHLFRPEVRSFYNIEKIWSVEPPTSALAAV